MFWGFHLGDQESKRRRYCLMCNVFKPERCHHCSACNRCVLNMDHHCPWINNCVGFWNRKYFMLLLIYVVLTCYFALITMIYDFSNSIKWFYNTFFESNSPLYDQEKLLNHSQIAIVFILIAILACIMTVFIKFHFMLVSQNLTTIENLERKA